MSLKKIIKEVDKMRKEGSLPIIPTETIETPWGNITFMKTPIYDELNNLNKGLSPIDASSQENILAASKGLHQTTRIELLNKYIDKQSNKI
jgi:hypothetical protein